MTMKKTTRQKKGSVIAILAVLFTGGLSTTASDVEAGIALLKAKGIPAFVQTIARDKTRAMPSVRSDKMAGKSGDQNPNDRLLGQELIDALQTRENLSIQDLMTRTDETLEIRDWALRKAGYGNLLVAYAAEDAATRLLFRSLAATNCDLGAVEAQVKRLRTDSPSTAYWLDVLNTEEVPNLLSQEDLKKNDEEKKPLLLRKLSEKTAAEDPDHIFPSVDVRSCYQHRSFPKVVFTAVFQELQLAALQACIEAKKKAGNLPTDEVAFKALIKESASSILKDKKRLSGYLASGQVWLIWQEYTAPDSGKP